LRYPLGQPVRVPTTVRQANLDGTPGPLVDAGTLTLVVKLAQADGTWATTGTYATPVHDGTGLYHQDVPAADLTGIGHYQYTWTATGTGAGVSFGDFDVFDPFEQAVLPLQDAKDQINISQTITTSDAELLAYIATIETSLEGFTGGPVVNRSITERAEFTAEFTSVAVRQRPLVSVASITDVATGAALDLTAGLDLDANACIIARKDGSPFPGLTSPVVTVAYVAGWGTSVPAAFNYAARIILQHMWDTQHGPSARPSMGGQELVQLPGFAFLIPNRAAEALNGSLNGMTFRQEAVFA
jgi:hypothetical protein